MSGNDFETKTVGKVAWRIIPFLVLVYIFNFIDRVNLGFAALTMNTEFGFSATVFGWGAGVLFLGYFFFGVPGNLILARIGARRWLSVIMVIWGLVSSAMIFVQGEWSFYFVRFMIGATEAGFFPGVILYLTYWFPASWRGTFVSRFMFAQPVALMIGSALSGWLLRLDGLAGLSGWKWMFILEGLPSSALGIIAWFYLTDRPKDARWLSAAQRAWLQGVLDSESRSVTTAEKPSTLSALTNVRVLLLCTIYLTMVVGVYGVNMWLPQIVKSFGDLGSGTVGILSALPFLAASVGMLVIGWSSDRLRERKWHVCGTTFLAGSTLLASTMFPGQIGLTIALIALSSIGTYSCMPIFWTIPPTFLTGTAAAAGIGLINSIGNLGGFLGPFLVGYIKDATGSYVAGLIFLGSCVLLGSVLTWIVFRIIERNGRLVPGEAPAAA